MPARFYIDLIRQSETIRDDLGVEADSVEELYLCVDEIIVEMKLNQEITSCYSGWTLVVRDEDNEELRRFDIN